MTQEIITRVKLTAAEGMVLTNGETFGKEVYLGNGDAADNWHEITASQAEAQQAAREAARIVP